MLAIGSAGVPLSSPKRDSISGIYQIHKLGLTAMELEFVRGVRMSAQLAKKVRQAAEECHVKLTVHAPYYINLNSQSAQKRKASIKMILQAAQIGYIAGAHSVTFHPAYYGADKEKAHERVVKALKTILTKLKAKKIEIKISPETTGKKSQFGDLAELIRVSKETGCSLCIDFAHLHARHQGKFNSYDEFKQIFKSISNELGKKELKDLHMHFSGIAYNEKGERYHLNLKESDFNYKELCRVLKEMHIGGVLISESPNLEGDALLIKKELEKN